MGQFKRGGLLNPFGVLLGQSSTHPRISFGAIYNEALQAFLNKFFQF